MRADGAEKKRFGSHTDDDEGKANILGPLLGPAVPADSAPSLPPENFVLPDNLEFIGLELELPVGFKRLRWALLNSESTFVTEAVYQTEARYEKIVVGEWSKYNEYIGKAAATVSLPDGSVVDEHDFIGAEKEAEYLMPKSAFVSANMCYETHYIVTYNDYCFCLKKRARNPDAPFGKTFIAWTQYRVVNTGEDSCKLTCSVEPEFPNGEPMVSRQIRSGMRAGTGELFVLIGETVAKYADAFP
jgi:VAD1 Analog of StAR-related lipid transfer domain